MTNFIPTTEQQHDNFVDRWCRKCQGESQEQSCELLTKAWWHTIYTDYPKQWIIGYDGPICTAFEENKE